MKPEERNESTREAGAQEMPKVERLWEEPSSAEESRLTGAREVARGECRALSKTDEPMGAAQSASGRVGGERCEGTAADPEEDGGGWRPGAWLRYGRRKFLALCGAVEIGRAHV